MTWCNTCEKYIDIDESTKTVFSHEIVDDINEIDFRYTEEFYTCPRCGGEVFTTKLLNSNINRAHVAYIKAKIIRDPVEIRYRGYTTNVKYSKEDDLYYGKIEGIKDLVNYESEIKDGMKGIKKAFEEAVDDYIKFKEDLDEDTEIRIFNCVARDVRNRKVVDMARSYERMEEDEND